MAIERKIEPTGTGQQGAGSPAGSTKDIPIHIEGEPAAEDNKAEHAANRAAHKGLDRQHREDPTVFTK